MGANTFYQRRSVVNPVVRNLHPARSELIDGMVIRTLNKQAPQTLGVVERATSPSSCGEDLEKMQARSPTRSG